MMKRIQVLILSIAILGTSCSKFVDIPDPKDQLASGSVFTDDKTATAAITGIYSDMNQLNYYFASMLASFTSAMSADEMYYGYSYAAFDEFYTNSILPGNSFVKVMWTQPYSYIYQANSCLEGLEKATALSENVRNQLLGEARFVRAFCYFYLVNLYGDVPLVTTTDYKVNNVLPRTPVADVYKQVITDLEEAVPLMNEDYATSEHVRPNRSAAEALLARVYLYTQQWANAEKWSGTVIDGNRYHLLEDLNGVFLKNSDEAIWQLQTFNAPRNTWEGFNAVPLSAVIFRLQQPLVNAFEPGDLRKEMWTGNMAVSGAPVYYPFKYKVRTSDDFTEYSMVLRFAEQYLIRAEARAQQDNITGALADLDTVRHRAGLEPLPATLGKAGVLLAVEQERRVELFTEWGHRWLDLKRTNRADAVLQPIKPAWKSTAVLLPIPTDARKTNSNLTQNEGYN